MKEKQTATVEKKIDTDSFSIIQQLQDEYEKKTKTIVIFHNEL